MTDLDFGNLIILALIWLAGYFWGRFTVHRDMATRLYEDPDHFHKIAELSKKIRASAEITGQVEAQELRVETNGDQLYLYTADTNEFFGQGQSVEEIIERVQKFKPGTYYVKKDQL